MNCSKDEKGTKFNKFLVFFKGKSTVFAKAAAEAAVAEQTTGLPSEMANVAIGGTAVEDQHAKRVASMAGGAAAEEGASGGEAEPEAIPESPEDEMRASLRRQLDQEAKADAARSNLSGLHALNAFARRNR